MIFLKPNRVIIDVEAIELNIIVRDILLKKPQVMILPEWVEVIEVKDIEEDE